MVGNSFRAPIDSRDASKLPEVTTLKFLSIHLPQRTVSGLRENTPQIREAIIQSPLFPPAE